MLALHAPSLQGASGLSLRWMQVRRGARASPAQKSGTMSTICRHFDCFTYICRSKQQTQRSDEEIPTYNDCPGRAGGGCECTDKGNAWILDRKAWLQDIHTQHPP